MKILAVGDVHGNTSAVCNVAIPQAKKNGCTLIMQCGDMGFWPHVDKGRQFLDKVSKRLVANDLTMYWIDGNHENHPKLWADYPPTTEEGLCLIRPNLFYVPRGTVFKLGHVTCLGLGGAFSIDRDWRLVEEAIRGEQQTLFWPTEMVTDQQVSTALNNVLKYGPVDVMFTHDCPTGTNVPGIHSKDKWKFPETWENRDRLREVFDQVKPKLLVHGHYHVRYTDKLPLDPKVENDTLMWDYCRVDGLANDGLEGFAVCLDMDVLFVRD